MKLCNNLCLIVREKPQTVYSSLIILPDTKNITSKGVRVLAVPSKLRTKSGFEYECPLKPGDRSCALQYDGMPPLKAWEDLEFEIEVPFDEIDVINERLPEGAKVDPVNCTTIGNSDKPKKLVSFDMRTLIKVKKGTTIQLINIEECMGIVPNGVQISDGK